MSTPEETARADQPADATDITSRKAGEIQLDTAVRYVFAACGVLTVLVTAGIIYVLIDGAQVFFASDIVDVQGFLTGNTWKPTSKTGDGTYKFGILPLVSGTLIIVVTSAVIALPTGLGAAIYLSEYASPRTRAIFKPTLEILAGVPTIVYGFFALFFITPFLDNFFQIRTFNALSAGIVVGIMIIPMVSSISEDAISAVPNSLREAAYGLGSTKFETTTRVVVPSALSGIISSYVLALSRAIGETMAVTVAAGQSAKMPFYPNVEQNLLQSIETITAAMINVASADIGGNTPAYDSMFALGLALFGMTFVMNLVAEYIAGRYREEY
ncbi:phosphate ABC transporter permease subunit PstC [Halobacteriales archaeon QH_10_67_13]|nr:MAG: phosphate ABC transporter permease subunit PstC [Halobacteriales archaeon QH_10_67_13]